MSARSLRPPTFFVGIDSSSVLASSSLRTGVLPIAYDVPGSLDRRRRVGLEDPTRHQPIEATD